MSRQNINQFELLVPMKTKNIRTCFKTTGLDTEVKVETTTYYCQAEFLAQQYQLGDPRSIVNLHVFFFLKRTSTIFEVFGCS